MALILHEFSSNQHARAHVAQQLALSTIAQDIEKLLVEAWEINGDTPGHTDIARLRRMSERAVSFTQPSRPEAAMTAAKLAHRDTLAEVLEVTATNPKYADHSSKDLVRRALTDFANTLDRLGVAYVIAAHDASLEAGR